MVIILERECLQIYDHKADVLRERETRSIFFRYLSGTGEYRGPAVLKIR